MSEDDPLTLQIPTRVRSECMQTGINGPCCIHTSCREQSQGSGHISNRLSDPGAAIRSVDAAEMKRGDPKAAVLRGICSAVQGTTCHIVAGLCYRIITLQGRLH